MQSFPYNMHEHFYMKDVLSSRFTWVWSQFLIHYSTVKFEIWHLFKHPIKQNFPVRSLLCCGELQTNKITDHQVIIILVYVMVSSRSQWPRGRRDDMSSPARTLGSWVRIPLKARTFVCVYSVFVLSCTGSGLTTGWIPHPRVLPTMYRIKKLKKRPMPKKGLYSHNNKNNNNIRYIDIVPIYVYVCILRSQANLHLASRVQIPVRTWLLSFIL
jgi:hypothetical protein